MTTNTKENNKDNKLDETISRIIKYIEKKIHKEIKYRPEESSIDYISDHNEVAHAKGKTSLFGVDVDTITFYKVDGEKNMVAYFSFEKEGFKKLEEAFESQINDALDIFDFDPEQKEAKILKSVILSNFNSLLSQGLIEHANKYLEEQVDAVIKKEEEE